MYMRDWLYPLAACLLLTIYVHWGLAVALGGVLATHYILPEGLTVALGGVLAAHYILPEGLAVALGGALATHYICK